MHICFVFVTPACASLCPSFYWAPTTAVKSRLRSMLACEERPGAPSNPMKMAQAGPLSSFLVCAPAHALTRRAWRFACKSPPRPHARLRDATPPSGRTFILCRVRPGGRGMSMWAYGLRPGGRGWGEERGGPGREKNVSEGEKKNTLFHSRDLSGHPLAAGRTPCPSAAFFSPPHPRITFSRPHPPAGSASNR
jgi:hypothetical protein